MSGDKLADLREETRAIIRHIRECLVAARNFDRVIALIDSSVQAIDSSNTLRASLRTMHELVHDVDVHIARAGDTLIGDVVVSATRAGEEGRGVTSLATRAFVFRRHHSLDCSHPQFERFHEDEFLAHFLGSGANNEVPKRFVFDHLNFE